MKLATVKYTGRVRNQRHRGPSGTTYNFSDEAVLTSMRDVTHFKRKPNFEVTLTARGKLLSLIEDDLDNTEEAISELGYNVKRSMVSKLDLEVESREESELEKGLQEAAEEIQKHMENM